MDAIESLTKESGHPMRLRDVQVPEGFDMTAFHAIGDINNLFNARPVADPREIVALYQSLY